MGIAMKKTYAMQSNQDNVHIANMVETTASYIAIL